MKTIKILITQEVDDDMTEDIESSIYSVLHSYLHSRTFDVQVLDGDR